MHEAATRMWLTPKRLTVRRPCHRCGKNLSFLFTNYRFTVRVEFSDGTVGDLTTDRNVTWEPAANLFRRDGLLRIPGRGCGRQGVDRGEAAAARLSAAPSRGGGRGAVGVRSGHAEGGARRRSPRYLGRHEQPGNRTECAPLRRRVLRALWPIDRVQGRSPTRSCTT